MHFHEESHCPTFSGRINIIDPSIDTKKKHSGIDSQVMICQSHLKEKGRNVDSFYSHYRCYNDFNSYSLKKKLQCTWLIYV